MYEMNRIQK